MEPITREEYYFSAVAGNGSAPDKPITRQEMFLAKMAGQNIATPAPVTRVEKLYQDIIENGGTGGGGEALPSAEEVKF